MICANVFFKARTRPATAKRARRSQDSGYAFLMVMFLVLVMAIGSQVALQNLYTQGRRMREDDMIWRGNQYARAIRLYFRKTGHYPKTIDDLKTGLPELSFLRYAAYKDPTNSAEEGAWRFIYVNASGQIIGSVRYATLQQMALMDLNGGTIPTTALPGSIGTPVASMSSGSGPGGTSNPNAQATAPGGNTPAQPPPGSTPDNSAGGSQTPNTGQTPSSTPTSSFSSQPVNPLSLLKPTGPVDGPVLGAFLTGVGGGTSSDAPSIKVHNFAKKYKDWEFIWNPLEDQARAAQQGLSGAGAQPVGQSGTPPSFGFPNPSGPPSGLGGTIIPPSTQQPPPQNP